MSVKTQPFSFRIIKKDQRTQARLGILRTPHGTIKTPSYVMVATHAQIKGLKTSDLKKTKTQVVIANTFHLWDRALAGKKVHKILGAKLLIMTDSGGFQVFSLGAAKEHKVGKVLKRGQHRPGGESNLKITEKGVYFAVDNEERFLSPELSIQIQEKLGADVIFAFDECTSPLHSFKYNKQAMERTHRWAIRCLKTKTRDDQMLFGIVQGGTSSRLRTSSAKYIGSLSFDGFGIGGSFGENEMAATLKTVVKYLPDEKPRHLLGIGRVKDIFTAIENGIDLFDCVIPTREARHGRIWTNAGHYDIRKSKYANDLSSLEKKCGCRTCRTKTRAEIHMQFKGRPASAKASAGRFATIHNIWFFNSLLEKIRASILNRTFLKLKKQYLR